VDYLQALPYKQLMTDPLQGFRGTAYNPVPQSENQIHGDEIARQHGFRGGLVPGVVVSAYLLDPAVRAFGLAALGGSYAEVVVHKPLYDGDAFEVKLESQDVNGHRAALFDAQGTRLAESRFELRESPADPLPSWRGLPRVPRAAEREPATREIFSRLQAQGLGSLHARFDAEHDMARYHPTLDAQPALVRPAPSGYANFAFLLGITDWALARNVRLGPWLHLQTWSHHLAPVPYGSELAIEASVHDLFERKGHEFVDIDVAAFDADKRPVLAARLRAIYKLRGA
jgi:acyl dehydratase